VDDAEQPQPSRATGTSSLDWRDFPGNHVVVHALASSQAAERAGELVEQADATVEALIGLLQLAPDRIGEPVDLYVVDAVAGGDGTRSAGGGRPDQGTGSNGVVYVLSNDALAEPLSHPLTRFLIDRWFGPDAARSSLLVQGLGGLAAAVSGSGPDPDAAGDWVRSELMSGKDVTVLRSEEERAAGADPALVSFMWFLTQTGEPDSLSRLLESYRPERRDEAFESVFGQPLAPLEAMWLGSLMGGGHDLSMSAALKFLLPLIKPHTMAYLEAIAYMMFGVLLSVVLPLVAGCMVDALQRGDTGPEPGGFCGVVAPTLDTGRVVMVILILLLAHVIEAGLLLRRAYVLTGIFAQEGARLRERMFAHLQRLPHSFYSKARIGDLTSRLSQDLEELQGAMEIVFGVGMFNALLAIFASVTTIAKAPLVGAIVVIVLPAFIVVQKLLGPRLAMTGFELQEASGEASAVAQENLSAQAVIKALGLEERAISSYRSRLAAFVKGSMRMTVLNGAYEGSINLTTTISRLIILGVGSLLIIGGTLDEPATLVTLLMLLPNIIDPVSQLTDVGQSLQGAAGSVQRANEIFEEPVEIDDAPDATDIPPLQEAIALKGVTFGYDPERPVLSGLDLEIPKGKHIAIVGPSGSGKSTIVNLVMRFYDPQEGQVAFDGTDIRKATLASLRGQIGLVFQETFVFNTTLRENIAIARAGATDEEVEAAAAAAQLDSLVETLPAGFDTVLGERGSRMSGGQRQRLSIARALLRDPAVLILDEATSALDARTEAEILETLSEVVEARTTITITHRLVLAAVADEVVVLDEGRVVERGPHAQLVEAGGLYQRLYDEQMGQKAASKSSLVGLEAARLAKIPLLADLGPDALNELAVQMTKETFTEGSDIIRQGEAGDKLYLISRGEADVLVDAGMGEQRVNVVREGDYFGEFALLTQQPRTATVRAATAVETYTLNRNAFILFVESRPEVNERVDRFVAEREAAFDAAAEAAGIM
jgi:ABC-type multidrug transport system fused ATPase/permease subunit